jgi:hypothetical protein
LQAPDGAFGTNAPSSVGKFSELQKQPSQRVANDRPHSDHDHLPISLLYHGFGRFFDAKYGSSTDGTPDINRQQFEFKVNVFMEVMNAYYCSETDRTDNALQCLNDIFACYLGNPQPLAAGMVFEDHRSDGHVLGPANTIEAILQVRNELGSRGTDPAIEISTLYTQSLKQKSTKEATPRFLFPALGKVVILVSIEVP